MTKAARQEFPANGVAGIFTDGLTAKIWQVEVFVHGHDLFIVQSDKVLAKWPLRDLRERRDQPRDDTMILSRRRDGLERLTFNDQTAMAVVRQAAPNLRDSDLDYAQLRKIGFWAGATTASILMIVFVIVPALADQLAVLVPPESEQALGEASIGQIQWALSAFGDAPVRFCEDPDGLAALDVIMARLEPFIAAPFPVNLRVIDHDMQNAFAVPGGQIVVFDGLLQAAQSPEEVAGVIGHELGHVVHRDPLRLALRSAGTVGILGMVLGDFSGGALAVILTEQLISASYAQDAEAAADAFGFKLLADSGLPSSSLGGFFDRIAELVGSSDGPISHLASHPDIRARADAARVADKMNGDFIPVLNVTQWHDLRDICKVSANHAVRSGG